MNGVGLEPLPSWQNSRGIGVYSTTRPLLFAFYLFLHCVSIQKPTFHLKKCNDQCWAGTPTFLLQDLFSTTKPLILTSYTVSTLHE